MGYTKGLWKIELAYSWLDSHALDEPSFVRARELARAALDKANDVKHRRGL